MLPNYSCTTPISLLLLYEHEVKRKKALRLLMNEYRFTLNTAKHKAILK